MTIDQMKQRCDVLLIAMLGKQYVEAWWSKENLAFNMLTPLKQWELDPVLVYRYLMGQLK
jgi:hypothetical protein